MRSLITLCLMIAMSCTVVRPPVLPSGEETVHVYVLTKKNWQNFFFVSLHSALALPNPAERCGQTEYVQFGFADREFSEGHELRSGLGLMTFGLLFPTSGAYEYWNLGVPDLSGDRKSREGEIAALASMPMRALEITVSKSAANALFEDLAGLDSQTGRSKSRQRRRRYQPTEERRYHLLYNNCHHFVVDQMKALGVCVPYVPFAPRTWLWFACR